MPEVIVHCPRCAARNEIPDADADTPRACEQCGAELPPAGRTDRLPAARRAPTEPPTEPFAGSATPDVAAVWQPGQVLLDLYEVKQVHDSGGMALVYQVHHRGWDMDLAVKCPRPEYLQDENGKVQFEREADTWVRLGLHPHIVTCYYVRRIDRVPCIFAEYVDGGTLSDSVRDGKLYEGGPHAALERILDIAIQLAWGLHYAHEQGLVHQDVKPANVLLTSRGLAKVTDFGLARTRAAARVGDRVRRTSREHKVESGGGMTPAYCSPEQKARRRLSRKTDIWSWGVTVLEMFCGKRAWRDGTRARHLLEAYLTTALPDKRPPPMPPRLAELLGQVFRENPDDRPRTMRELVDVLRDVYQQQMERAYAREAPEPAEALADGLNNRAISLLDLGKRDEAEKFWQKALELEVQHPESAYNLALFRWRSGRLTDEAILQQMREVCASHPGKWRPLYLLALVHVEREDVAAARAALSRMGPADAERGEVAALSGRLDQRVADGRTPLLEYRSPQRHSAGVMSLALSRDGRLALSGGYDWSAKLWEVESGTCLRTLEGHEGPVLAVALSPDGRLALTGSVDKTVRAWDAANGQCLRKLQGHSQQVSAVCLTPGQKYALSASWDGTVTLWELAGGKCVHTYEGHTGKVNALAIDRGGKRFLSGGGSARGERNADHTVRLWELTKGRSRLTLAGHTDRVAAVAFTPDGGRAVSGSSDRTLRLWDVESGSCLRVFEGHDGRVTALCVSTDGSVVFSAGEDRSMRMWDVKTGRCLRVYQQAEVEESAFAAHEVTALAVSADMRRALTGCVDGSMRLWRVDADRHSPGMVCRVLDSEKARTSSQSYRWALQQAREALAQGDTVTAARQVRLARAQPGYGRKAEAMEEWTALYTRLTRQTLSAAWEGHTFDGHTGAITDLDLSCDGRLALSASADGTVRLWDAGAGSCVRTFSGHEGPVHSACLSADQKFLLTAGEDRTVRLWKRDTGACIRTLAGHQAAVRAAALTADRRFAVSGGTDKALKLWRLKTSECLRNYAGRMGEVGALALSTDGRFALAGGPDRGLWLWDLTDGRCIRVHGKQAESTTAVCLAPVGWEALSAGGRAFHLWDLAKRDCLRTFEGHGDTVTSLAVSADGRHVLSGSWDRTARLWDLTDGRCLRTFAGHPAKVTAVALSSDGRFALTGCEDGALKYWVLDWELEDNEPADWHDGALPYLEAFLTLHTPYLDEPPKLWSTGRNVTHDLLRRGTPVWEPQHFEGLMQTLGSAGYGWLRPEGVERQLQRMAAAWQQPPACPW